MYVICKQRCNRQTNTHESNDEKIQNPEVIHQEEQDSTQEHTSKRQNNVPLESDPERENQEQVF